jgi:DNA polymerase-1
MSAKGLQIYAKTTYGVDFTEQEAEKHRATFFKTYPGLARWHAETKRLHCRETRGTTGRRRKLPVNASDTWRLNSPVQADEADGLKSALGLLWQRRADCPSAYPVLAIHDEIVIEVVESEAEQAKAWLEAAMMDGMAPLLDPVPCLVESTVKKTWGG